MCLGAKGVWPLALVEESYREKVRNKVVALIIQVCLPFIQAVMSS